MAKDQKNIDATTEAQERADELGINLADVKGTGKEGRVLIGDVEGFAEREGITDKDDAKPSAPARATASRTRKGKGKEKPVAKARLITTNKTPGPGYAIAHDGKGISISTRRFQTYTEQELGAILKEGVDRYGLAEDDFEIVELKESKDSTRKPVSMSDLDKERSAPVHGKPEEGPTGERVGKPETGPGTPEGGTEVPNIQADDSDNPPVG